MSNNKKWSRDWLNFDWTKVRDNMAAVLSGNEEAKSHLDIGISKEEFLEFLDWLRENHIKEYHQIILMKQLSDMGLEDDLVEYYVAHPEELSKIVKLFLDEDSNPE